MKIRKYFGWVAVAAGILIGGYAMEALGAVTGNSSSANTEQSKSKAKGKGVKEPDSYAYQRGVEYFNEGKYEDALDWFNKELEENPDNGYALVYVSTIYYGSQEYGRALSILDKAMKHLPKKDKKWAALAYASRSEIYKAMQDTVQAVNDLTQAIDIDPSNSKYFENRAEMYYEQEKYDLSDADYRQMIALDRGDIIGYMGLGRNANAQKRWDDAISQFDYVIKFAPDYSSGYSFRAESYLGKEKWAEATDDIIKGLDIDGDDKAFYLMGHVPEEAVQMMKAKLKIQMTKQPSNRYWPYCLGVLANVNEDYDEAIVYYSKAHALDAGSVFLKKIAECYISKDDYTDALDYIDRTLAMEPEYNAAIDLKGDILSHLGRYEECLVERDKIISQFPEYFTAYFSRAEDLMAAKRYSDAIEDYNMVEVLEPNMGDVPYLLMKRGDAYRLTGKGEQARKDYERLLEVEKDSVLNSNSWTPFAYSGLGNAEKAIETMQHILANDTTDVSGNLYNAACVYGRIGRNAEALKYLAEALDKGYRNMRHIMVDYDLDAVREMPEFKELIERYSSEQVVSEEVIMDPDFVGETEIVEVPFTKEGGVTKVKCTVNGLPLHFVFDTGAADVTMSMVEANFMLKNDYIKPSDIMGSARYVDANGDISEGTVVNLRKVDFGGLELENVRASVVRNQKAPLLLGQSVLGRLGKIEIDNPEMKLIVTHKVRK